MMFGFFQICLSGNTGTWEDKNENNRRKFSVFQLQYFRLPYAFGNGDVKHAELILRNIFDIGAAFQVVEQLRDGVGMSHHEVFFAAAGGEFVFQPSVLYIGGIRLGRGRVLHLPAGCFGSLDRAFEIGHAGHVDRRFGQHLAQSFGTGYALGREIGVVAFVFQFFRVADAVENDVRRITVVGNGHGCAVGEQYLPVGLYGNNDRRSIFFRGR